MISPTPSLGSSFIEAKNKEFVEPRARLVHAWVATRLEKCNCRFMLMKLSNCAGSDKKKSAGADREGRFVLGLSVLTMNC